MISFRTYLIEKVIEDKLKHLEHAEDHHFNTGHAGFFHAINTLKATHNALLGKESDAKLAVKYDGSPSMVFGHNPENNRFFVASKSAFNKNPKINYTEADVEKHHGHAPGLVSKLKQALNYLPKIAPKSGVYQGDFLYSKHDNDVESDEVGHHFKPNTIRYSAVKGSPEAKSVEKSKIGVAVHTAYEGPSLLNMKAQYGFGGEGFKKSADVHMITTAFDRSKVSYDPQDQEEFNRHITHAEKEHAGLKNYEHMKGYLPHVKTYVNSTIKDNTDPHVAGFREHVKGKLEKDIATVKTLKAREQKTQHLNAALNHIDTHADKFQSVFNTHKHIQNAKNVLVKAMERTPVGYEHSIKGEKTAPEGFVVAINNRPTKLVNRRVFSMQNMHKATETTGPSNS